MRPFNGKHSDSECTPEEDAEPLTAPGPFRDFRRALSSLRWKPAPFDKHDLIYIALSLPKDVPWTIEGLAEIRDEVVEFSFYPELARAYVEGRLSGPFSAWMRDKAEAFEYEMTDFYEDGFEMPAPSSERSVVLTAVFLRLYDAATEANVVAKPAFESTGIRLQRRAS